MASCRSCLRPIFWAVTKNQKLIPIDAHGASDGNVEIRPTHGDGPPLAIVHKEPPMIYEGTLHHTHFTTCTNPEEFRRPRNQRRPAATS